MSSSSKVILAATMIMVVSLVMVLSLVLVLLAELYCSLLLNRRRRHSLTLPTTTFTTEAISTTTNDPSPSNVGSGVVETKTHLSNFHNEQSLPIVNDPNTAATTNDFIYISNPVYSNDATSKSTTPFETPQSSPSRLETGDEDEDDSTPTLTPIKDLPQRACSVSLKDVRSSSASESNDAGSSSSSASPYTSPSW